MKNFLFLLLFSAQVCFGSYISHTASAGAGTGNVTDINLDVTPSQTFAFGSSGSDLGISDGGSGAHTLNVPDAGASARGVVTTGAQTLAGVKTFSSAPICSSLTATTVPYLNGSKALTSSAVTPTELGYVSGVTSALQTQLNAKEGSVTATTTADYYRGDKSFQTLNSTAVGLGNVANVNQQNGTNITSGTVADARLSSQVTLQANTFNGASQLVQLDGSAKLPAVDGSALTGLLVYASSTVNTTNNTATTVATQALSDTSSYTCKAIVSGFRTDSQDTGHWEVNGSAYRNGGACVFEDSTKLYEKRSDANFSVDWSCSSNNFLLKVTGNTGKTIHWKAYVICQQAS